MAGAHSERTIDSDTDWINTAGASVIGGLRPFFVWAAVGSLLSLIVVSAGIFDMTMWTGLVGPVVLGAVAAKISLSLG